MMVENYRAFFIRQWKFVCACFVAVGLGTFIASRLMTPLYQSTAIVQVIPHTAPGIGSYMQTEVKLATSDAVLREVARQTSYITPEQLAERTRVTPVRNTQLFEITVQDRQPTHAADLANAIAGTLLKQQVQVAQRVNSQEQKEIQKELIIITQNISDTAAKLQEKDRKTAQLTLLQTQLSGLQQHYSQLQNALTQLELAGVQNSGYLQIVQRAQPEYGIVLPDSLLTTSIGSLAGLLLGIILALLFEQLDMRVRTTEELEQLLQWPMLARLWRVRDEERRGLLNHTDNADAYNTLHTNIGYSEIDRTLRSMLVTSAASGDGKSIVAANLAIFSAKAGKNTLLIDADLRHPVLHKLFDLDGDKPGFTNAVIAASLPKSTNEMRAQFLTPLAPKRMLNLPGSNALSIEEFAYEVDIPNLRVMPAGSLLPNPTKLLDSKALRRFFIALKEDEAEIIIFDTPPLEKVSDAALLAAKVDGTLVVIDANSAHKGKLKRMKATLTQVGASVLGCVINKQHSGRQIAALIPFYPSHDEQREESKQNEKGRKDENVQKIPKSPIAATAATRLQLLSATRTTGRLSLSNGRRREHRHYGRYFIK